MPKPPIIAEDNSYRIWYKYFDERIPHLCVWQREDGPAIENAPIGFKDYYQGMKE